MLPMRWILAVVRKIANEIANKIANGGRTTVHAALSTISPLPTVPGLAMSPFV
jgi:hypothetical protein